jgi:predicted membrane protein
VGDLDVLAPRTVGIMVKAGGFVIDSDLFGNSRDSILNTVEAVSPNYAEAESRLVIETACFVTNIKVRQI